jgi:hypothetical protein
MNYTFTPLPVCEAIMRAVKYKFPPFKEYQCCKPATHRIEENGRFVCGVHKAGFERIGKPIRELKFVERKNEAQETSQ